MSSTVTKNVDIKVGAPGAEKVPGLFERIGHSIHHMNAEAKQSPLHGIETILKGAGVAAAGHFLAESIKEAATSFAEAAAAGDRSYSSMIGGALRAIPVVGSVADAIEQIAEAWRLARLSKEEYEAEMKRGHELKASEANKAMAHETYKRSYVPTDLTPELKTKREMREEMDKIQQVLTYNTAHGGLEDEEVALLKEAYDNFAKRHQEVLQKINKQQNIFVRKIRQGVEDSSDSFWLQAGRELDAVKNPFSRWRDTTFFGKARDLAKEELDRQNEVDLEAWRGAAEARQAAEESFMSEAQLDLKQRREAFLKMAADDRLPDDLRKKALQGANNLSGIYTTGGYSPNVQGQFLTGAHAASGETGSTEAKIANSTEKTAKNTDDAAATLKDIAAAFKKNPAAIFLGIGL